MYNTKFPLFLLVIFIFSSTIIFSQTSANSNANVKVNIKKGLSIDNVGSGELDFGEYLTGVADDNLSIAPSAGVSFEVLGHPGKNISIDYDDKVTLDNDDWVTTQGGGTNGSLIFTANVEHTGGSSTYGTGGTAVSDNGTVGLVNDTGVGKLYLWLGGNIPVTATTAQGEYTGAFTITVAY